MSVIMKNWSSNGKLLITGEYMVMEGAEALAIPVNRAQSLQVEILQKYDKPYLFWHAKKPDGEWFNIKYSLPKLEIITTSDNEKAIYLRKILKAARLLNPLFLNEENSIHVKTILDFPPQFGLGSSSTLITNIARWANINPFELQFNTIGGSAYDVACALAEKPVIYKLVNKKPVWHEIDFHPPFYKNLFFVYLGKKQNSAQGIKYFKSVAHFNSADIQYFTEITRQIVKTKNINSFSLLLQEHEKRLSKILKKPTVKELLFKNVEGTVKSLGAWGGDFVLFATPMEQKLFVKKLNAKGFIFIFAWNNFVLNP